MVYPGSLKTVKGATVLRNMDFVFNGATGNLTSRTMPNLWIVAKEIMVN